MKYDETIDTESASLISDFSVAVELISFIKYHLCQL